jgi:hypothetical protein
LTTDNLCRIFGMDERPAVCIGLRPGTEMCGQSSAEAIAYLVALEQSTRPTVDREETLPFASPEGPPYA